MKLFFLFVFTATILNLNAQTTASINQVITLKSNINNIIIELNGNVIIKEYRGSRVLIETKVSIDNGSSSILNYWLNTEKRYSILIDSINNSTLKIYSEKRCGDYFRSSVTSGCYETDDSQNTKKGVTFYSKGDEVKCTENITYIVYMPSFIRRLDNGSISERL